MTKDVESNLLEYIKRMYTEICYKVLNVTWYGGEPLLNIKAIERLTYKFINFCIKNKITYNAGIITNGYYLTTKNINKLNELSVNTIQVTLDGNQSVHDSRRYLINGQGTFNKIIENIQTNYLLLKQIYVRVNLDKENQNSFFELKKFFEKIDKDNKIIVYPGFIVNSNNSYCNSKCLSKKSFSEILKKEIDNFPPQLPDLISNICGADMKNSFVIDSRGNFYKCWNEIGLNNRIVRNINQVLNEKLELDYLNHNPLGNKRCKNCPILPLCMGGCIYHFGDKNNCSSLLYNLEYIIRRYVQHYFEKI